MDQVRESKQFVHNCLTSSLVSLFGLPVLSFILILIMALIDEGADSPFRIADVLTQMVDPSADPRQSKKIPIPIALTLGVMFGKTRHLCLSHSLWL